MKDYSNWHPSREERLRHNAKKTFEVHAKHGDEDTLALVNGEFKTRVILKEHTNPMNFALEDKKMYFVNEPGKMIRRGDVISGIDEYDYIVVTIPESNGVTSKCRVRKMYDEMTFAKNGEEHTFSCVVAKGLLYDAGSYASEDTAFTEEGFIALIVQYNNITQTLEMFDPVIVNGEYHRIVKVDPVRLKEYKEDHGVLQLILSTAIACVPDEDSGDVMETDVLVDHRYGIEPFKITGILRYAKLKERIYNSKAREILTPHNVLKPGDYIEATFLRNPKVDKSTETRIYLTQSLIDMRQDYDSAFLIDCNAHFNIKDDNGDAYTVWAYFENNSTQLMSNERNSNMWNDNSKWKCLIQSNELTRKLGKDIARVIIDGEGYEIVGTDRLSAEGVIGIEFVASYLNPSLDNMDLQIADYYRFDSMEDVTSDEEFETIYEDANSWSYLVGDEALLLGEQGVYEVFVEPKISENKTPQFSVKNIELVLTDIDGNEIENGDDIVYATVDNKFYIKTAVKVPLLGTKLFLTAKVTFEETIYDVVTMQYITKEKVSENTKYFYVSGW
jgi:hypothetical protein